MIDLKKDLFVHMVLSARSLKEERLRQESLPKRIVLSDLEKTSFDSVAPIKNKPVKTMEETIEEVVDNPKIKELRRELSEIEVVFERLKKDGDNLDFLYRIENKINQLKKMIDQKTYF